MLKDIEVFKQRRVKLSEIMVPKGLKIRTESIESLVDSIKRVGLLNPMLVDEEMGLVSGFHRHQALMQINPEQEVDVRVLGSSGDSGEAIKALSKLDENLVRYKLTSLDESQAIHEKLNLIRRLQQIRPSMADVGDTAKHLAKEMGVSVRKIYLDNQIASLDSETIDKIKHTPIANSKQSLAKIARAEGSAAKNAVIERLLKNEVETIPEMTVLRNAVSEFFVLAKKARQKYSDKCEEAEIILVFDQIRKLVSQPPFLTEEQRDQKAVQKSIKSGG